MHKLKKQEYSQYSTKRIASPCHFAENDTGMQSFLCYLTLELK